MNTEPDHKWETSTGMQAKRTSVCVAFWVAYQILPSDVQVTRYLQSTDTVSWTRHVA